MKCRFYKTLQKGEQNFFLIRTNEDLGALTSVRIWLSDDKENKTRVTWLVNYLCNKYISNPIFMLVL